MTAQASVMKSPGRIFSVAVVGASERDIEILERVFGITRYRQRCYKLVVINDVSSASELARAVEADIHVLNVTNPKAIVCWQRFAATVSREKRKPVLRLGQKATDESNVSEFVIPWPINPAKLLQTLDNFTIRHLHYYPEFEIGSEVEPSSAVVHNIKAIGTTTQIKQEARQKAIRVLVADDSLAVRRQLTIEFDSMDAHLDSVADGDAAVKATEQEKYDVIFLDVVMPGLDGYSVCKNIRRSALNKTTPVIMLTSRSSKFDKLKGILAGCDTYLTKPINHNEFKEITQKHLVKSMEK